MFELGWIVHCNSYRAQVAFWPIILECVKHGGVINQFGGGFPAYELEAISLNAYNYSLLGQDSIYTELIAKLPIVDNVIDALTSVLDEQQRVANLRVKKVVGSWTNQSFKDFKDEGNFEIVKLSDNAYYLKANNRYQKLIKNKATFSLQTPLFGWYFLLYKKELALFNHDNQLLISYSKNSLEK